MWSFVGENSRIKILLVEMIAGKLKLFHSSIYIKLWLDALQRTD